VNQSATLNIRGNLFQRIKYYFKDHRPWFLRGIRIFLKGLYHNPLAAIRWWRQMADEEMASVSYNLQIFGPKVLAETLQSCQEVGIRPILIFGSLLGYYREGEIIKTDGDLDFGILEDDIAKMPLLKSLMEERGYRINPDGPLNIHFHLRKKAYNNCLSDFWFFYRYKDTDKVYTVSGLEDKKGNISVYYYPAHLFENLQEITFLGQTVLAPQKIEEYLHWSYGKNWRIPYPLNGYLTFVEKQAIIYSNFIKISPKTFKEGNFLDRISCQHPPVNNLDSINCETPVMNKKIKIVTSPFKLKIPL
jgi:hypothetical protein